MPGKIPFDPSHPDADAFRQIVVERLRHDAAWRQLDPTGCGFTPYVEYVGQSGHHGRHLLLFLAQEVFWQLIVEGILAPGADSNNLHLPWFHITGCGREVLASGDPQPTTPPGISCGCASGSPSPMRP